MDPSCLFKSLDDRELFAKSLKPIDLLGRNRKVTLYQRDIKGESNSQMFIDNRIFLIVNFQDILAV
jgi:hypothetical protein